MLRHRQSLYLTQRCEKTKREGRKSYIAVLANDEMICRLHNGKYTNYISVDNKNGFKKMKMFLFILVILLHTLYKTFRKKPFYSTVVDIEDETSRV